MPLCFHLDEFKRWDGKWEYCSWAKWWDQFCTTAEQNLRATVNAIIDAILYIRKAIATLGFYFHDWVARWAATDAGLAMMILDGIILIVCVSVAGPLIAGLPFVVKIKTWVASMKAATGGLLAKLHLTELVAVSKMLEVLWPDYRKLVAVFENALAGLSEDLGYGTGMIVGVMGGVRAIIHSSYTILGWDAKAKEVAWFDAATDTFKTIRKKFFDYAYEPGKMMDDLIESIVLPASQTATDAQVELLEDVESLDKRAHEIAGELQNIFDSVDDIVDSLPEKMTEHFRAHWTPIKKDLDRAMADLRMGLLDRLDGAVEVWKAYAEQQNKITERLAKEANEPLLLSKHMRELTLQERELMGEELQATVDDALEGEKVEVVPEAISTVDERDARIEEALRSIVSMPSLGYEPEGLYSLEGGPASSKVDWYIGEY